MNLRYTFSLIRIMKIPGLFFIIKDWRAIIRMHFIFAAYESGLLNAMVTPCDRETLIEKLHVKRPPLLDALLDVGLATKELTLQSGIFSIKGRTSKAIIGDKGDMLAAMIQANVTYYNDVYRNAAQRLHGGDLGTDLERIGDLVARFSKIVEPIIKDFVADIVHGKNPMRVLDVGCGSGALLRSTYSANRDATGIGIDVDEEVVKQARENISLWGLADRFDVRHGDIRHSDEITGPFDLVSLYNILYYFDQNERLDLLNRLRCMISDVGALAIVMSFRSMGKDIASANLNMANCSLRGLTSLPDLDDITSLLKRCGFGRIKVHRFMPGSALYGIVAHNS